MKAPFAFIRYKPRRVRTRHAVSVRTTGSGTASRARQESSRHVSEHPATGRKESGSRFASVPTAFLRAARASIPRGLGCARILRPKPIQYCIANNYVQPPVKIIFDLTSPVVKLPRFEVGLKNLAAVRQS